MATIKINDVDIEVEDVKPDVLGRRSVKRTLRQVVHAYKNRADVDRFELAVELTMLEQLRCIGPKGVVYAVQGDAQQQV